jgi:REP element-mobilizing transposase RayT
MKDYHPHEVDAGAGLEVSVKEARPVPVELDLRDRGLDKAFWGRHLWGRGYFVASTGNASEEIIAQYIKNQGKMDRDQDADFEV